MGSHVSWQHVHTINHKRLVLTKILKTELKVVNNYSQASPPQAHLPDLIHTAQADRVHQQHQAAAVQIFKANKDRSCWSSRVVSSKRVELGSSCHPCTAQPLLRKGLQDAEQHLPSVSAPVTYRRKSILLDYFLALCSLPLSFLLTARISDCELLYFFNCFQEQAELYLAAIWHPSSTRLLGIRTDKLSFLKHRSICFHFQF